jgi:hypothetical protein
MTQSCNAALPAKFLEQECSVQSAKRVESEKRAAQAKERQNKVAKVEKQRKKQKGLYLKKTKRGQPVMKHRIDKILGQLQA